MVPGGEAPGRGERPAGHLRQLENPSLREAEIAARTPAPMLDDGDRKCSQVVGALGGGWHHMGMVAACRNHQRRAPPLMAKAPITNPAMAMMRVTR